MASGLMATKVAEEFTNNGMEIFTRVNSWRASVMGAESTHGRGAINKTASGSRGR